MRMKGMPYTQICKKLGGTDEAARKLVERGYERIRERIEAKRKNQEPLER